MSAKEMSSGSRRSNGNRNCSSKKGYMFISPSSRIRGMEFKPSPEKERIACSIRSNKRRVVVVRNSHKKGFAQKILGGHGRPLQLGVRNCRGALYERPRCIFCAKPTKRGFAH